MRNLLFDNGSGAREPREPDFTVPFPALRAILKAESEGVLMIDVGRDELLSLKEAAAIIPSSRPGRRVCLCTIWRWMCEGLADGTKLDSVKLGAGRFTTREAIAEFSARLTEKRYGRDPDADPDDQPAPAVRMRTPRQRAAAHRRAEAVLDKAGIR